MYPKSIFVKVGETYPIKISSALGVEYAVVVRITVDVNGRTIYFKVGDETYNTTGLTFKSYLEAAQPEKYITELDEVEL